SWRTATSFSHLGDEWKVIYEREGKPVVIERSFGEGTLVLASDSYFVSNEALKNERHAELLSWLVGPHLTVIFDESHLGITRNAGIMTLVRGYGLYAAFLGLLVLALLYIWKNAFSFVPPYEDEVQADARHAVGKDSAAGFTNLLRRSIIPRDLLGACLAEYRRSLGYREKDLAEPLNRMKTLADAERVKPSASWNPADAYAAMSRVLAEYLGRRN
ncbi:MAG: hypothetical protein IT364_16375, partial [Candidatus Hydrogenedentes bacterium]|nr:hypothetical protein [Candidatus Hydrogenedentota bacterium]